MNVQYLRADIFLKLKGLVIAEMDFEKGKMTVFSAAQLCIKAATCRLLSVVETVNREIGRK